MSWPVSVELPNILYPLWMVICLPRSYVLFEFGYECCMWVFRRVQSDMQGGAEKLVEEGFELVVKKEGQRVQWAHCVLPKFIRKAMGNDQLTNLPHLLRRLESSLRTCSHFDWNRLTPRSPCTGLVVIYDHLSVCVRMCCLYRFFFRLHGWFVILKTWARS